MLPLGVAGLRPQPFRGTPPRPRVSQLKERQAATVPLLGRPGTGRVLWARHVDPSAGYVGPAAWLRLPEGVIGLAPSGAPLGPRWISRPEPWPALTEADPVVVDAEGLRAADGTPIVSRGHAVGWLGALPGPPTLRTAPTRALIFDALSSCRDSAVLTDPWRNSVGPALAAIGRLAPLDALKVAAAALGGLGPGLTPAGDDVLSGILFAFRAVGGPPVEPALIAVARSVRTTELASALLEAAAGGCHIEPVHDLVMAAAAGDSTAAGKAASDLDRFGSSSGADVAHGLRVAFIRQ